jgi:SAM-dependent methyltransferase
MSENKLISTLRWIYHRLPVSTYNRHRLQHYFYVQFPLLFRNLPSFDKWKVRQESRISSIAIQTSMSINRFDDLTLPKKINAGRPNINYDEHILLGYDLSALLGEAIWHSVTLDPSIRKVSQEHFNSLQNCLTRYCPSGVSDLNYLEIAAYAHITGYMLAHEMGANVTLFDISANTLHLGSTVAEEDGYNTSNVRRVAGDFHSLPFKDSYYDIVYICSAVHHTERWQQVVREMIRVLAPGGILIIENEPCLRELCFYKFRTNRMENFSEFETALNDLGLICTIAEPYLGSRPETLFGMTENQEIGLEQLIGLLGDACLFEEINLNPEICMEEYEQLVASSLGVAEPALSQCLERELTKRLSKLKPIMQRMTPEEMNNVPTESEISGLSRKIASIMASVSNVSAGPRWNPALLPGIDENRARSSGLIELIQNGALSVQKIVHSRLFGAGVRIVARKANSHILTEKAGMPVTKELLKGVEIAFPDIIQEMMHPERSLLPTIQTDPSDIIKTAFGNDWRLVQQERVRCLIPLVEKPCVPIVTHDGKSLVIFFRCYAVNTDGPWRLSLMSEDKELCHFDIYQTETILLAATVRRAGYLLQLRFVSIPLEPWGLKGTGQNKAGNTRIFNIYHCGAVILE